MYLLLTTKGQGVSVRVDIEQYHSSQVRIYNKDVVAFAFPHPGSVLSP